MNATQFAVGPFLLIGTIIALGLAIHRATQCLWGARQAPSPMWTGGLLGGYFGGVLAGALIGYLYVLSAAKIMNYDIVDAAPGERTLPLVAPLLAQVVLAAGLAGMALGLFA